MSIDQRWIYMKQPSDQDWKAVTESLCATIEARISRYLEYETDGGCIYEAQDILASALSTAYTRGVLDGLLKSTQEETF